MMMIKTKAIVLHAFKFGEGKLMVEMFTQKRGCVTFVVRPSASPKGAMKKQYFQPFTLLEVEFDYRPKNDLQHLKSVGLAVPLSSIPFDAYKLSITLLLYMWCITNPSTNPCLIIFFIALNGWTVATIILPIFIWFT